MASVISERHIAPCGSIGINLTAQQPAVSDTTYIGLATLVPVELHALCTCAHLFYARMQQWCADGELVRIEIAALPHYFAASTESRQRHVRTMMLSAKQFALLVEYDRQLAGMPTCDVRELVTEHALAQGYHPQSACQTASPRPPVAPTTLRSAGALPTSPTLRQTALVGQSPQTPEPSALFWREGPTITLSLETLRDAAHAADVQERTCSSADGPVPFAFLVLRAALTLLATQRQQETDQRERTHLTRQLREVRRVLVARREIPPRVVVTPLYEPGKARGPIGCTVHIGVPLPFAA